jgi:glutaredoxin
MKFTVYSKDGCPYCTKVQQVLEMANLQHVVYKLGRDFTRQEFYSEFGQGSTFPQVILNDQEHIGGCSDTVKFLREQSLV